MKRRCMSKKSMLQAEAHRFTWGKKRIVFSVLLGLFFSSLCYGKYAIEGTMDGEYDENGVLRSEWGYIDKKKDIILLREYYESGKVLSERVYKDHTLIKGTTFDEEGRIISEEKPVQ